LTVAIDPLHTVTVVRPQPKSITGWTASSFVGMLRLNKCAIYCREWLPSSHLSPTVSSCTRAGKRPACLPSCHPRKQSSESLELPMKWTACCSSMPSALLRHQHSKGLQPMPLQALLLLAMVPNMTMAVLVYAMEGWCCVWWEESCQRASTSVMASAGDSPAKFHEDLDVECGAFLSTAKIVCFVVCQFSMLRDAFDRSKGNVCVECHVNLSCRLINNELICSCLRSLCMRMPCSPQMTTPLKFGAKRSSHHV